ncbi:NAD(P)-binding protein [Whalleya microplaca]|nr:NAD(P)-binding protein [Whalleya microplaca]
MAPTIVLITGANRGIGKGLLQLYLAKPNHTVIAGNRDPDHPTSQALADLPKAQGTSLLVVKIDATVRSDPAEAFKTLESKGIDHIDILIANVGIALSWPKVREVDTDVIQPHVVTNIYGFLWLFQAAIPVLKKAQRPIWVTIGSSAAYLTTTYAIMITSLRNMLPTQNAAYAPTKLTGHWYTKAIHIEEPWLTAFPIDPGWEKATVTVEDSTEGIVKVIDVATRETHGGKMWTYAGSEVPW